MPGHLSAIVEVTPQLLASATLRVDTPGAGFTDITGSAAEFIDKVSAGEGTLLSPTHLGIPYDPGKRRSRRAIRSECCA